MSTLSTHVLDAVTGNPAVGVEIHVFSLGTGNSGGSQDLESLTGSGVTNDDGRVPDLVTGALPAGVYRIVFATESWFSGQGVEAFYPEVSITFRVTEERHYHVPLLLSPFAFSTYRGS